MKLSIANQPIAIPQDATISIEKSSPVLEADAASFSYPFPVPRLPNQFALGWPGKLERLWELPGNMDPFWGNPPTTFILEDQGIQILSGEVEFDDIDDKEIGIILKSGSNEFASKIKEKKMADVDFGSEAWLGNITTWALFDAKRAEWNAYNVTENSPVIAVKWSMNNEDNSAEILGNTWQVLLTKPEYVPFGLQFKAWYLIEKIFEFFGYTILVDHLKTSEFVNLIVFTCPFYFKFSGAEPNIQIWPPVYKINYAEIMPDITVQDFLDGIKSIPGLVFLIDDRSKQVTITFLRSLFARESIDPMSITELKGWIHREHETTDGFELAYQSQDDANDTKIDYAIDEVVENTLPTLYSEGRIVHVNSVSRDYITLKKSSDSSLYWSMIGRLKPYISGKGGLKIEFPVKVPPTHDLDDVMHPYLGIDPAKKSGVLYLIINDMTDLYVSLYRGIVRFGVGGTSQPLICAEKYVAGITPSLVPADLYTDVYYDYLIWKSLRARPFTKYIQLTLPQLISLQWDKRYCISGIWVILDKINYELPYKGVVKIEGYTA